jgi:hypothetical protein
MERKQEDMMNLKTAIAFSGLLAGALVLTGCMGNPTSSAPSGDEAFAAAGQNAAAAMLAVPSTSIHCPKAMGRICPDLRKKIRPCMERPFERFRDECRKPGRDGLLQS